jgi:hypothetical protein
MFETVAGPGQPGDFPTALQNAKTLDKIEVKR